MSSDKELLNSAHRQMGAIVAKALDSMEGMSVLQTIHPLDFDVLRRCVFDVGWEAYKVGLRTGRRLNGTVHDAQS
jgi:hypothetical protein